MLLYTNGSRYCSDSPNLQLFIPTLPHTVHVLGTSCQREFEAFAEIYKSINTFYRLIYHNPFQMLGWKPYLCNLRLTCNMSHDGAKEICDGSALIRNCDYIIGPQQLYIFRLRARFVTCSVIYVYRS